MTREGEDDAYYFAFESIGRGRARVRVPVVGRNETLDDECIVKCRVDTKRERGAYSKDSSNVQSILPVPWSSSYSPPSYITRAEGFLHEVLRRGNGQEAVGRGKKERKTLHFVVRPQE